MNKTISLVIGAVAVVALILGGIAINKSASNGSNGVAGVQGVKGDKGDKGDTGARGPQGPAGSNGSVKLGAATGPDTYFDYVANNSLQKYGKTIPFTTGTTTVCAIKSPVNATSTLVFASAQFIISSTTASTVTLAEATTPYATTTVLNNQSISANAQGTVMGSSTPVLATGATNGLVFPPATYLVVGMAGGIGTFSPSGSCSAEFIRN